MELNTRNINNGAMLCSRPKGTTDMTRQQ